MILIRIINPEAINEHLLSVIYMRPLSPTAALECIIKVYIYLSIIRLTAFSNEKGFAY